MTDGEQRNFWSGDKELIYAVEVCHRHDERQSEDDKNKFDGGSSNQREMEVPGGGLRSAVNRTGCLMMMKKDFKNNKNNQRIERVSKFR